VLFQKIVAEIAQHNVTQRISPYLMNEPFFDKEILDKARYIRERVPAARLVLTTNGSLLTEAIVENLVTNNPLRALYISMQGIEKETYEATMRGTLVFEKTKKNIEHLIEMRNRYAPNLKIVVTMVKTNRMRKKRLLTGNRVVWTRNTPCLKTVEETRRHLTP